MADKQYDVSEDIQRLFKIKQKKILENREYYRKIISNPHRPFGEIYPFDPVVHRFNTLTTYSIEHFKPTPKSVLFGLGVLVFPLFLIHFSMQYERERRHKKIREGKVGYENRRFIMLY